MGWEPETVLTTNIELINLALEGKLDFVKKTNPFGSGEESEEEKLKNQLPNPEMAAKQLIALAQRRMRRDMRHKPKKNK